MIEIASRSKTASRSCNKALELDYYEMLTRKNDVEHEIREVLEMVCETSPAAQANLKCQFPNHETLVNSLRTCAKLVVRKYDIEQFSRDCK
jgi:folate-dependent tRNA-U54 methylase TrmFO/GidA